MAEAFILESTRTAIGRRNGALAHTRIDSAAGQALRALMDKAGAAPGNVDDVIMGCVTQVGEQGMNIGRVAALAAGFPIEVTGCSVNRMCGSSQQAINFAAMAVMSGQYDLIIAAGAEAMSRIKMGSDAQDPAGEYNWWPGPEEVAARFDLVPQGVSAEMIAEKWKLSRQQLDEYSLESHMRAAAAREKGWFDREISPIRVKTPDGGEAEFKRDEGVRPETSLQKLAGLATPFKPDGVVTAGSSSQISDGAAAVLIGSRKKADELGLKPRARIVSIATAGVDPVIMLTGPIPATQKALARAGLKIGDMDLIEINEAFAPVVLAFQQETGCSLDRVNVNGGAIALGHPLGASGARLMTTLLHEMERRDVRYGLSTMCIGFGIGVTTIIDRKV
ncbi:MAG: 3-oxoadipyl-CoA/3-oxo-5,6-dehydrosuberyl-CoA thiolase [Myxococcota bacterium]|nr:3-oxoadipyl-CoA/3-oxo-5,6-dehydrosuberyl-CoA thiolase [Myxococcota bacterium]